MCADEQDDYSARVIVHEFQVCRAARTDSPDPSNSAIPETSVFQDGSKLVRNAVRDTGWKDKRCFNSEFTLQADACFIWAQEPPHLLGQEKAIKQNKTLKSWGDPITEEEFVRLSELDEFEHVQRRDMSLGGESPPTKKLFVGSLHGVIPQPHFYSSAGGTAVRDRPTEIPPYKKVKPVAIPPYGDNVTQLLHPLSAFARTAWIVPVRGILPWALCTQAVVLDDSEEITAFGKEGALIQWTNASLIKFWDFLKDAREAGNLGQVGVSFHVATARERESLMPTDAINEQSGNSALGVSGLQVWSRPLSSVDYIKIYHKASNAMSLRNILDAWGQICPHGRKIRVLKGSRLALVDERCRGILVS